MSALPSALEASRVRVLRANSFAATVMLLIEYGLGVWVDLYGHLPAADHGADVPTGFARAVADGPLGLSLHALLGVALIVSAVTALVRAIGLRRPALVAPAALALVAIVVAAASGASYVGKGDNAASMAMAMAAGVAIAAYVFVLFVSVGTRTPRRS